MYSDASVKGVSPAPTSATAEWPQVFYFGTVPVKNAMSGSALLYRMFERAPSGTFTAVEHTGDPTRPADQLVGTRYHHWDFGPPMRFSSKLPWIVSDSVRLASLRRGMPPLLRMARTASPDLLLLVANGTAMIPSLRLMRELRIPTVVFAHDDWRPSVSGGALLERAASSAFDGLMRGCDMVMAISDSMKEHIEAQYDVRVEVIPPLRNPLLAFAPAPGTHEDVQAPCAAFLGAYLYHEQVMAAAKALKSLGGTLKVYSPIRAEHFRQDLAALGNVEIHDPMPMQELAPLLRESTDILLLPMSFDPEKRPNMEISFPSKIADYLMLGTPILTLGPSYCSAVRWARLRLGGEGVVDAENHEALVEVLRRLCSADVRRIQVDRISAAADEFSWETVSGKFEALLLEAGEGRGQ